LEGAPTKVETAQNTDHQEQSSSTMSQAALFAFCPLCPARFSSFEPTRDGGTHPRQSGAIHLGQ
jgi:hypothetical protein